MAVLVLVFAVTAAGQQNPSPMVEHTRAHPRLTEQSPAGRREALSTGRLFVPAKLAGRKRVPLVVHFHGAGWVVEMAAAQNGFAAIADQEGSGSAAYAKPFAGRARFAAMLREAEEKSGAVFAPITLSCWSAGYGAIREILADPASYARIDRVLLIDGLHTGYAGGKPGPQESALETANLDVFLRFARDAVARRKRMLVVHSEIFPGTFASTTETADWLLSQLGVGRRAVLRWGPMGTQQLSEARAGDFRLEGFAGNSAPDHVDLFHGLAQFLRALR